MFWAYDGMQVHANARAESLAKLRRSMSQQSTPMAPRSRAPERFAKLAIDQHLPLQPSERFLRKSGRPDETRLRPPIMSIRWCVSVSPFSCQFVEPYEFAYD